DSSLRGTALLDSFASLPSDLSDLSPLRGSSAGCDGGGVTPICTGVAAPRLVPGAMAAIWLAYSMYTPALAARAPLGATYIATGTGEARMFLIMWRMEVSSPPGVSISI